MFGEYFIWACPTNALHQFLLAFRLKKHWFIGLAAFLDINSEEKKSSQRECWFVSILAACQVCNSKLDWIPRWTEAISAEQTDESTASNEIPAGVCLSGQNGELRVKDVFGLDFCLSLLLMHEAESLFRRPLTFKVGQSLSNRDRQNNSCL